MKRIPEWQQEYFGRHVQLVPAVNARGYQYRPPVYQAAMSEGPISTPQADYWMKEGKGTWKPGRTNVFSRLTRAWRKRRSGYGKRAYRV